MPKSGVGRCEGHADPAASESNENHNGSRNGGGSRGRGRGRGRGRDRRRGGTPHQPGGNSATTATGNEHVGAATTGPPAVTSMWDVLDAVEYVPMSMRAHGGRGRGRGRDSQQPKQATRQPAARPLPPPQVSNLNALPTRAFDLAEALITCSYECMSCLEVIGLDEAVWSCSCCYSVFHLSCIQRWTLEAKHSVVDSATLRRMGLAVTDTDTAAAAELAAASTAHGRDARRERGRGGSSLPLSPLPPRPTQAAAEQQQQQPKVFSCPQCRFPQLMSSAKHYKCFCGKAGKPPYSPFIIPHSCGNTCGKRRGEEGCPHACPLQCHPGPCMECTAVVGPKPCPCGSTTYSYRCGQPDPHTTCNNVCGKPLACGQHTCERTCHEGDCPPCCKRVPTACVCGKTRGVLRDCGEAATHPLHCEEMCGRPLSCGHHTCTVVCHEGECPLCARDVAVVDTCPCGAKPLSAFPGATPRTSCLDPIPCCRGVCAKILACGHHTCRERCHIGDCPPCTEKVDTSCRCRLTKKLVPCAEVESVRCTRLCGTRLSCGRHYCREPCCADRGSTAAESHQCLAVCDQKLPCGHRCRELCHSGACPSCIHLTTDTLVCACGRTRLPPPQPCGTSTPRCPFPCQRQLPCGHSAANHRCHSGACPPCTALVTRICVGGHAKATPRPCTEAPEDAVCGEPCEGVMPCGHRCPRTCHAGPCGATDEHPCPVPCEQVHEACGHACTARCHFPDPCRTCKVMVSITCACGCHHMQLPCERERQMWAKQLQGEKEEGREAGEGEGHEADTRAATPPAHAVLPCDATCDWERRLKALAAAAGRNGSDGVATVEAQLLRTGTTSATTRPFFYSLSLWERAMKANERAAIEKAEKRLSGFVKNADQEVLFLPPAPKETRAIYHALARFYGVATASFGEGAKRSVMLSKTAGVGGPKIPPISLLEAVKDARQNPVSFFEKGEPKRRVDLLGPAVSEAHVSTCLRHLIGRFVYGNEVNLDGGSTRATVVFASAAERREGFQALSGKDLGFRCWKPEE